MLSSQHLLSIWTYKTEPHKQTSNGAAHLGEPENAAHSLTIHVRKGTLPSIQAPSHLNSSQTESAYHGHLRDILTVNPWFAPSPKLQHVTF